MLIYPGKTGRDMKKNEIFRKIRQEIISGKWHEGDKLPTEFEYTEIFQVSRDTIRAAFKQLEDAGYIERVKSKGTFVHLPEVDENNRIISILVPCDNYLRYVEIHFQQLLFDLIAEAARVGWGVVPVIFSKTNSNEDIWWENLAKFNRNSRIVVNHGWYAPYFKTLAGLGARVAFISNDAPVPDEWKSYTSQWINFVEEDTSAARQAVQYLAGRGCRKIALAMLDLKRPRNPLLSGFSDECSRLGLRSFTLDLKEESDPSALVADFYRKKQFDGLLVHLPEDRLPFRCSFREALGLPPDMPVVSVPVHNSTFYSDPKENLVSVKYRVRTMAHDIVKYLIDPQYRPQVLRYGTGLCLPGETWEE